MISIIIPVYNSRSTIEKCIRSVLNQSFSDWELIIVDDGSTDGSSTICDKFAELDSRIKVYHKKNGGVSSSRNFGIHKSSGTWIEFLDSDDVLLPNALEVCLKNIDDCQLLVFGYRVKSNNRSVVLCNKKMTYSSHRDLQIDFQHLFENGFFHPVWNKLYRRSLIKELFDERLSLGEDLVFNINYLMSECKVVVIPYSLYMYNNLNEKSATHKFRKDVIFNQIILRQSIIKLFQDKSIINYINKSVFMNVFNSIQLLVNDSSYDKAYKYRFINHSIRFLKNNMGLGVNKRELDFFERVALYGIVKENISVIYFSFFIKYGVLKLVKLFKTSINSIRRLG